MPSDAAPGLTAVGDGVYAWLLPPVTGTANAGVVVDDDGITVIDTLMVRSQWEPFAAAVEALDVPVKRTILTHAHIEQSGGTRAFPKTAIYGSSQTSRLLDRPMNVEAYKAFWPGFEEELDDLAEVGTRPVTHIVSGPAQLTGRIEVLPADGHTEGDLLVLVADVDVCFAGGLCSFGITPLAFQGDPTAWAAVLDAVADLADVIVPGHGPLGGEQAVRDLQAYLRACVDAHGDVRGIPAGPWDAWTERSRDAINVERADMLARGDDDLPPSMLAAMGLA
jgi:glyoxylase-like metal-dependent hydrolase (beta-lactamase superfamily II)